MKKPTPEEILNTCIALLYSGKSVAYCLKKYPSVPQLAELLRLAERARRLPTRRIPLDADRVWRQITARIEPLAAGGENFDPGAVKLPFFRLPFPRLAGVVAGVLVCLLLLNTATSAMRNSLPGQPLYQVKRTVEKIQLVLALDDVQEAEIKLQHAENRLSEAVTIAAQQPATDPSVIKQTLSELTGTTNEVVEKSADNKNANLLKKVVALTDRQSVVLNDIETKVTGDAKKLVFDAIDTTLETKNSAQKQLALLVSGLTGTASSTPTTTPDLTKTPTTTPEANPQPAGKSASSTPGTLKALGTPDATITEPLLLPDPSSTTPVILDVR